MKNAFMKLNVFVASLLILSKTPIHSAASDSEKAYREGQNEAMDAIKAAQLNGYTDAQKGVNFKNLSEGSATNVIQNCPGKEALRKYPDHSNNANLNEGHPAVVKESLYDMKKIAREQLEGDRVQLDPNNDPIFVNANRAVEEPEETLQRQTVTYVNDEDYTEVECVDTRDEEFDVINTARVDPYYKRFEVSLLYNSCPNHSGWGKVVAASCGNKHLHVPTRRADLDYDETHGMNWKVDKHPDFEALFSAGKCRLKKEMPKEEGQTPRMVPVEFYKKDETQIDWNITKIDEYREGRTRFRGPGDFGLESFVKVQVYTCSYQSPGNTCTAVRAKGGVEKESTCIERMGNVCVKWKKTYKVPKPGTTPVTRINDLGAGHKEAFNMDGHMDNKSYGENQESADAIARLTALREVGAAMPKFETGDPNALAVFGGEVQHCVRQGGNNRCPGGSGDKEAGDYALERKWNEGKCIRVGTYIPKDKNNIGIALGEQRVVTTFCCFDSVLAKVLQQGAIDLEKKELGKPEDPDCAALTLGQLQQMDWKEVDFKPFVAEMQSRVNFNASQVANKSSAHVQSHLSHQMTAAKNQRMRSQAEASRARGNGAR
jgi:hypothetical protein